MRIVEPGYQIILPFSTWGEARETLYMMIERAGRTCYKSEAKMSPGSAEKFIRSAVKADHGAILEHAGLTVRFTVDRGVSHEIVRHRLASFAQESTRYCNYGHEGEITFIRPFYLEAGSEAYQAWEKACTACELAYMLMLKEGCSAQEARAVLPNSVKTEVVMTANMREWRHFFKLRACGTTGKPHPQMLQVAVPLLKELQVRLPALFDDLEV